MATPSSTQRKSLPLDAWPAADRAAWDAARTPGTLLDPGGGAADWRPASRQNLVTRYGRWLGWLAVHDPQVLNAAPAARVTPERAKRYATALSGSVAAMTVHIFVRDLYRAMVLFAPEADWQWLKRLSEKLRKAAKPSHSKAAAWRHPAELCRLGLALMEQAAETAGPARDRAVLYRDGLLIALLAARAPRRASLVAMNAATHLAFDGCCYWLVFPAEDTKQKRASRHILPEALSPCIDRYLDHHRPVLNAGTQSAGNSGALWLGENGQRLDGPAINFQIKKRTLEGLGQSIPPHRFRDCLATAMAIDLPGEMHAAATILDHASLAVTQKHYNQASQHQALRVFHGHLERLREDLQELEQALED